VNKHKLLFADNACLSLGPVTLLRELFRSLEEALNRGELGISSPDHVDGEHRPRRCEVEQLDSARELLDQGANHEADAAAFGDVPPDG
jgi:hypothetical protein